MTVFGKNLKKYLELLGWEQADLAKKLNITPASVSEWIVKGTSPRAARLEQIAELFGITVNDLLYDYSQEKTGNKEDEITLSKKEWDKIQEALQAKEQEIAYLKRIVNLEHQVESLKNIEAPVDKP